MITKNQWKDTMDKVRLLRRKYTVLFDGKRIIACPVSGDRILLEDGEIVYRYQFDNLSSLKQLLSIIIPYDDMTEKRLLVVMSLNDIEKI